MTENPEGQPFNPNDETPEDQDGTDAPNPEAEPNTDNQEESFDLEDPFKLMRDGVESFHGNGNPTATLRVIAYDYGYMIRASANGWTATKRKR